MKKLALTVWTMWKNASMKMTTATFFWRKTKSETCWRLRGNKKRQEISKERPRRGFGKPSTSATTPVTRKFRAEVEEVKLRTKCNRCGNVGHWAREPPQKPSQSYKGGGRGNQPWKKNEHFVKKTERDAYFCDWSPGDEPRFQCVFESRHGSMLERIRRRREQRCSLLDKAKKLKLERSQVCGELDTMLNSFSGKGIVDTGCAKMMKGSDTS